MNTYTPSLEQIREKAMKETKPLLAKLETVIVHHYRLCRDLTEAEVMGEIENLQRKHDKGNLDSCDERLMASLSVAGVKFENY